MVRPSPPGGRRVLAHPLPLAHGRLKTKRKTYPIVADWTSAAHRTGGKQINPRGLKNSFNRLSFVKVRWKIFREDR